MYNGIGLQTPRGSGTNGLVQTNRFLVKTKTNKVVIESSKGFDSGQGTAGLTRKPNKEILEHDRKRQISLKLLVLQEKLTDQGYTDAEIEEKLDEVRKSLEAKENDEAGNHALVTSNVSETQTHQVAARKERQMETLKAALGIQSEDDREKRLMDMEIGEIEEDFHEDDPTNIHKRDKTEVKLSKKIESGIEKRKHRNKKEKSKRRHAESSDSDSIERHETKGGHKKKVRAVDSSDDSYIDVGKRRKEPYIKHKAHRRYDSESESGSESGSESESDKGYKKAHRRYDSDDGHKSRKNSEKGRQQLKSSFKRKRHDSEDGISEGEHARESKYSSDDDFQRERMKRTRKGKKTDSDDDDDRTSGEGPQIKNRTERSKVPPKITRHDSDDEFDANMVKKDDSPRLKKAMQLKSRESEGPGEHSRKIKKENRNDVLVGYKQESDSDSDERTRKKREKSERDVYELKPVDDSGKYEKSRRDDITDRYRNADRNRYSSQRIKSLVKNQSDHHVGGSNARGGKRIDSCETDEKEKQKSEVDALESFKKLEQLFKSKEEASGDQDTTRSKRKRESTRESGYDGEQKSSKGTEDNNSRLLRPSDNIGGHGSNSKDKTRNRNESRHEDRRESRGNEGYERYKRERGNEEENHHGRKHERHGEEDSYRKDQETGRGGRGKEKEDPYVKDEREREYVSKRDRYEEERSGGRRYDHDRRARR